MEALKWEKSAAGTFSSRRNDVVNSGCTKLGCWNDDGGVDGKNAENCNGLGGNGIPIKSTTVTWPNFCRLREISSGKMNGVCFVKKSTDSAIYFRYYSTVERSVREKHLLCSPSFRQTTGAKQEIKQYISLRTT